MVPPETLDAHRTASGAMAGSTEATGARDVGAKGAGPGDAEAAGARDVGAEAMSAEDSGKEGQAGSDSIFGRRNFSSGLPTENTQMSSSKKDPSAPGNVKPPAADGESDSSECVTLRSSCGLPIAASSGLTIYNTVEIYRYRSWWSKHMENISEY
ncbi:uncharacterized protein LOC120668554 isoform X2 [Panicum virgatum]|uniref:uncharacterized protein LOC120668554 isoform X2 n=1 Tax=Panicum virgatum TaxID=38727 RepID=UPI0019D5FB84|nr:uncharacterized protein LOC120668554 isoform X2 [Panicum virgatum]